VWSERQPSAQQENEFLAEHAEREYRTWFLVIDDEHREGTKARYEFPTARLSGEREARWSWVACALSLAAGETASLGVVAGGGRARASVGAWREHAGYEHLPATPLALPPAPAPARPSMLPFAHARAHRRATPPNRRALAHVHNEPNPDRGAC
jgi:hypothetical protein